jgi:hypothetical protein
MTQAIRTVAGHFEVNGDVRLSESLSDVVEFFEIQAGKREAAGEFGGGVGQGDLVGEPAAADDHFRKIPERR